MSDARAAFHYFGTNSGQCVSYLDPKPEQIKLDDIALSLSRQGRGVGHDSMSTAQHSLIVTHQMFDECEENLISFIAHFCVLCSMMAVKPIRGTCLCLLKHCCVTCGVNKFPQPGDSQPIQDPFKVIEARLNNAILNSFGLDLPTQEERGLIKLCDRKSIALEMRDVMSAARRETFERSGYQFLAPREDLKIGVVARTSLLCFF